jgi:hypothetical protein
VSPFITQTSWSCEPSSVVVCTQVAFEAGLLRVTPYRLLPRLGITMSPVASLRHVPPGSLVSITGAPSASNWTLPSAPWW